MSDRLLSARAALERWNLGDARVEPIPGGLINWTFRVRTAAGDFVLQRVSPIFAPEVCDDVDRVTRHLAGKGVATPEIVTSEGGRAFERIDDATWRLMTFIDGVTRLRLEHPRPAEEAGAALGRFHAALLDFDQSFAASRLGVHDTERHLARLEAALAQHRSHPRLGEVKPVAEAILSHERPSLPVTAERIVHGDPKIANLIFDPIRDAAVAWVDLDTVGPMALPLEIGDALRSWCNRSGEDRGRAELDLDLLEAALRGYLREASFPTEAEIGAFIPGLETIALELASRFCRDALEESYFGWSPERFPTASHHHLARAQTQLALAREVFARRSEADGRLDRARSP